MHGRASVGATLPTPLAARPGKFAWFATLGTSFPSLCFWLPWPSLKGSSLPPHPSRPPPSHRQPLPSRIHEVPLRASRPRPSVGSRAGHAALAVLHDVEGCTWRVSDYPD